MPGRWGAWQEPDAGQCRKLWCTLLLTMIADARASRGSRERDDARAWLGTRDFSLVCYLAGFDPQAVLDRLQDVAGRARAVEPRWIEGSPTRAVPALPKPASKALPAPQALPATEPECAPEPAQAPPRPPSTRDRVRELHGAGLVNSEIADRLGVSYGCVWSHLKALGLKKNARVAVAAPKPRQPGLKERRRTARREHVRALQAAGRTVAEIAEAVGAAVHTVRQDLAALGLTARRPSRAAPVRDNRRFKDTLPPDGAVNRVAPADATGTVFPSRVQAPGAGDRVLIDGKNNRKIGGDVLVGRLKGAKILTLTLEERATCPRSCAHWRSCYGNNMQWPVRWAHGPELMDRIEAELDEHCASGRPVLVRLHVLGDFWSRAYVDFWARQLSRRKALHVFGFTAWGRDTPIGGRVAEVRRKFGRRFAIRHSGAGGFWGAWTLDAVTRKKRLGDSIVCLEQLHAGSNRKIHCGSCGVCWATSASIVFMEH